MVARSSVRPFALLALVVALTTCASGDDGLGHDVRDVVAESVEIDVVDDGGESVGETLHDKDGESHLGDVGDAETEVVTTCSSNLDCTPGRCCVHDRCEPFACQEGPTCLDAGHLLTCDATGCPVGDIVTCPDGSVCHANACRTLVCKPYAVSCRRAVRATCNPTGTGYSYEACGPGLACTSDGACDRNIGFVYVVYAYGVDQNMVQPTGDRTTSLATGTVDDVEPGLFKDVLADVASSQAGPCVTDHIGETLTIDEIVPRFLLKNFLQAFADVGDQAYVALFKPPAIDGTWGEVATNTYGCQPVRSGYRCRAADGLPHVACAMASESYPEPAIQGPYWAAPSGPDEWFLANLGDILLAPPTRPAKPAFVAKWKQWTDYVQTWSSLGLACTHNADCEASACVGSTCAVHDDPELVFPLWDGNGAAYGIDLFRVGEYIRLVTRPEGMACSVDTDCPGVGFLCEGSRCHDEARACREHRIVLVFSGREDDGHGGFRAAEQAYRLHHGGVCATDDDCFHGATCGDAKPVRTCEAPGYNPSPLWGLYLPSVAVFGPALRSPSGETFPVSVDVLHHAVPWQTTGFNMDGDAYAMANAQTTAKLGGGTYWRSHDHQGPEWKASLQDFAASIHAAISTKVCFVPPNDP